ncbi:uncharacterized protein MELLADRAFT_73466 [Melampsora larici-populina 98AG31]|uniref:Uncharacterized protein n=1 Tax=Melampsora larici-populina (strain 98AG31 / pathotype 3-4-7) TaxID=747676 RepID=F4S8K9_MELLP|nr:uncharacterized protein MELLADRAFT_73466 [Melampsora larici-populina 98AG31]EGF99052.1 hypothetical protein MELLADRAFT_73466 [Melampsora larici-populina 98AG31]
MVSSAELRMIDYLTNLPSDANPYLKAAKYLHDQLQVFRTPVWARCINGIIGILFLILLIQSCKLIVNRVKTKTFYLFKLNTLGLIKFDGANHGCVAYSFCSMAMLIDIICTEMSLLGWISRRVVIFIFATRSVLVGVCAWAFLWLCICHYAAVKFDPLKSQRPGKEKLISPVIIWSMNLAFLAVMFGPFIPMYWASFSIDSEFVYITKHLSPILQNLSEAGSTYSPTTYNKLNLFKILIPAKDLIPHVLRIEYCLRAALIVYLVDAVIISLTYPIILFLVFRHLRQYNEMSEKVRSQNKSTAERGFVTCISALSYVALNALLLSFRGGGFLQNTAWWLIFQTGLSIPVLLACFVTIQNISSSIELKKQHQIKSTIITLTISELK